jgi:hypothetical protein
MISNLFNRIVDDKGLREKNPGAGGLTAMSDEHITGEHYAAPSRTWTVKNKIKQFVESGRHLIVPKSRPLYAARAMRPDQRQMTFSLYAPAAKRVSLAGDFNGWSPDECPLEKSSDGMWEKAVTLPAGRHEYKFVVDGLWQNDPRCTENAPNPFGGENCVVILS